MKRSTVWRLVIGACAAFWIIAGVSAAHADDGFCAGFKMGYQTIAGNMSIVPICPIEPITPIGSTPFQEGLKAGMEAAQ